MLGAGDPLASLAGSNPAAERFAAERLSAERMAAERYVYNKLVLCYHVIITN